MNLIEDYSKDHNQKDFINSIRLQDLITRRLEIIGEAVKNLPPEFRNDYPDIEWKKIAGMRDYLIHAYFGIDLDLTWNVVIHHLPGLKNKIIDILSQIK
ncbi:MAG: DUF86 domain-containing protein [bacterium]